MLVTAVSTVVALAGIALAALFYLGDRREVGAAGPADACFRLYSLSLRQVLLRSDLLRR